MLRKIQNTYYIIAQTEKGDLQVNKNQDALKIEGFTQEIDFTFRKELTDLPVKKSCLHVFNKITIEKIEGNISPSLVNFVMEIYNIFKAMKWLSSIKAKISGMLLEEEFLKSNVLFLN